MPDNTDVSTLTEAQLAKLEEQIRKGSAAFITVGTALAKIREGRGYRLRGFETFEQYCQTEFGFTDRQGRRLIQSAETSAEVKKLTGAAPANESVAREFASVAAEPEKLKRVTEQLERKGYSVVTATAEAVKEAVAKLEPKPKVQPALASSQAVVLGGNGNGHRAADVAAPAKLDAPTGECPWCHERPSGYEQSDETWQCSNCSGTVMLSVIQWPPETAPAPEKTKACPTCKRAWPADQKFCHVCGSRL